MINRADIAAVNIKILGFVMACDKDFITITAAIRNVLSPISDTSITENAVKKEEVTSVGTFSIACINSMKFNEMFAFFFSFLYFIDKPMQAHDIACFKRCDSKYSASSRNVIH
jgi:hypothetical protein